MTSGGYFDDAEAIEPLGQWSTAAHTPGDTPDTVATPGDTGDISPHTPHEETDQESPGSSQPGDAGDDDGDDAGDDAGAAADEVAQLPGETLADRDARLAALRAARAEAPGAAVTRPDWRPGQAKYDWPTIKKRYVEGVYDTNNRVHTWPSLAEVAAHFGLGQNRIREKSADEGWVEQRRQWQAQVEATRQQARAAALAKNGVALDDKAIDTAKLGLQLCYARLGEIAEQAQRRRAETAGTGGQTGIDAQEQQRLAAAVDLWHKIGMRAIGDPESLTRIELTGAGGRPIEISQELTRDDPNRLTGVLAVLAQAGLGDIFGGPADAARALERSGGADGGEPSA